MATLPLPLARPKRSADDVPPYTAPLADFIPWTQAAIAALQAQIPQLEAERVSWANPNGRGLHISEQRLADAQATLADWQALLAQLQAG